MIPIGNQTSFAAALLEPFEFALASAFTAFEWFPDKKPGAGWDDTNLDQTLRRTIRECAARGNLRQSVHVRWQANPFREGGLDLFWKDLALAMDLDARLLNVHLDHERGIPAFVDVITPILRRTAECGVELAIENTPHHSPELFNELFACLRAKADVPSAHVGMCLDVGHANLCAATRNRYIEFVDRLSPELPIVHLHLHENWGDADTHLTIFTGPSGQNDAGIRALLERLQQRDYAGSIILEQWPQPPALLAQARDRLLALMPPPRSRPHPRSDAGPDYEEEDADEDERGEKDQKDEGQAHLPSPALGPFGQALAAANHQARSWRQKLDVVQNLLSHNPAALTDEGLATIAVYLRFLNTGQLPCTEDGRHFRPSHHARAALEIQKRLARCAMPENAIILRKIHPWLPSTAAPFQRAEPLTRIRDIAHRNDIPSDLKREIKTTLQNKLHRCAGPEDLATSRKLLDRITAPGAPYSQEFVAQFKVFHDELLEFFNARSLDMRLEALRAHATPKTATLITSFLRQKSATTPDGLLRALEALTELRRACQQEPEAADSEHPGESLLADIALEDFAFTLSSQVLNALEAESESGGTRGSEALRLILENLALGGVQPREVAAILAELRAWGPESPDSRGDDLLRLAATVGRARRLAESQSARIIALFAKPALQLGPALGVAEEALKVFTEAEIRNHLIFQLSKLASLGLRRLRERLGLPPWDVLVPGTAIGLVRCVSSLEHFSSDAASVVLVEQATGYEEIPANIKGLILAHDLPHLSHLAVRARQAGVVLAASEELGALEKLKALDGNFVALTSSAQGVSWEPTAEAADVSRRTISKTQMAPTNVGGFVLETNRAVLHIQEFTPETVGQKAFGIRRLAEIAIQSNGGFKVPHAVALPFGSFEAAIKDEAGLAFTIRELRRKAPQLTIPEIRDAATRLPPLLHHVPVSKAVLSQIRHAFPPDARLMVRSSSNCEDLAELAGAGLYESVANVSPHDLPDAIRKVWGSLWTERALLSRRQADLPEDQAFMAVLIQELVLPDFAFVLHTVSPITHCADEAYVEIAPGLGETLVSGATRGSPYRLVCNTTTGRVETLAFANFSEALWPTTDGKVEPRIVDYSTLALSRDHEARRRWALRLGQIGRIVEKSLGGPQDIEGIFRGEEVFLVQARPQQGVSVTP
jgi:phosphoglucan,water dikinase